METKMLLLEYKGKSQEQLRKEFQEEYMDDMLLQYAGCLQEHKINLWQKRSTKHRINHHAKVFNLGVWRSPVPRSTSDEEFEKRRKEIIWVEKSVARMKLGDC